MRRSSRLLVLNGRSGSAASGELTMPAGALAIVGTERLAGWNGACCRVRRISDNVETDIGWVDGRMDKAAIIAHAGVSKCAFKTFYDMSGNGNDYTQTDPARQPTFEIDKPWGDYFGATSNDSLGEYFDIPAAVSVSRQACTVYTVHAPQAHINTSTVWQLDTAAPDRFAFLDNSDSSDTVLNNNTFAETFATNCVSQPMVTVVASSATEIYVHKNDRISRAMTAAAAATCDGGFFGKGNSAGYTFYGELMLHAVYGTAHDLATINAAKASLYARYAAYDLRPANTKGILANGDSLTWAQTDDSYNYPYTRYLQDSLSEPVDVRNIGVPSRSMSVIQSNIGKNVIQALRRDYSSHVYILWAGTNDIFNVGSTAASVYATMTAHIAYVKSLGYYVIVMDVIDRFDGNATYQAEAVTLRGLIAANSAGADGVVVLSAVLNDNSNATYYSQADRVHLRKAGYAKVAELVKSAVETGLAWTPPPVTSLGIAPSDIPNAEMFIDSSDVSLTNILTDGAYVYQANDKVSAYAATAGAVLRPVYLRTSLANGKPAISFSGGQYLDLPSSAYATSAGANTLIVGFRSANSGDATQGWVTGRNASSGYRYGIQQTATALQFSNFNASTTAASIAHSRDTNPHICGFTRSGTNLTPFLDGVAGAAISNAGNTSLATLRIGAQDSTTSRVTGDLLFVIRANAALSNAQLNTLCAPIAAYYGATWTGL